MTPEQSAVQKIREALAAGPTDGPWTVLDGNRVGVTLASEHAGCGSSSHCVALTHGAPRLNPEVNAAYIAACDPATIRTILAALDAAQAEAQAPLTLATAPIGTKAPHVLGGYWVRVAAGWKWCTGSTFPRPGGDWTGELIPPNAAAQAPREVPRLTDEDVWKSDDIMSINAAAGMHMPTLMRLVRAIESRVRDLCGVAP